MASESDLIRRYTGAFSPEECLLLRRDIDLLDNTNILYNNQDDGTDFKDYNVNRGLPNNIHYDVASTSHIASKVFRGFRPCVEEYLKTFTTLGRYAHLLYDCKVKKIPVGGGFHRWHHENGLLDYAARSFVVQLYLNDNFEGGETEFLYQNRREKAVEGDVLIFPAAFTHVHRGNPPIGNVKYLINSWGTRLQSSYASAVGLFSQDTMGNM